MGRRNSGSFRMALRGKPVLILLCFVILAIFVVIYFRRSSSTLKYKSDIGHHGHKNSFNMGSNLNFDANKFIRTADAEKLKNNKVQPENNVDYKGRRIETPNSQNLDLNINNKIKQNNANNLNDNLPAFNNPLRNKPKLNNENKVHDGMVHRQFDMSVDKLNKLSVPGFQDSGEEPGSNSYKPILSNENEFDDIGMVPKHVGDAVKKLDKFNDLENQDSRNEIESLYHEPDANSPVDFKDMKRIVHLDLKGAPPNLEYFQKILPVLKSLGATGLLVEYEDMFPYGGKLSSVPAGNALSKVDVVEFLHLAQSLNFEVIPLIQTFGHMEFILKLEEFSNLRESDDTPQVIAPSLNESYAVIQTLIDQIVMSHPLIKYIHLGCDEVYELGRGRSVEYMKKNNLTRSEVFFEHVRKNVMYLKQKYAHITPIVWDDEFRHESLEIIQKFGLGNVLEPMIWSYQPNPRNKFSDDMWEKYGKAFKNVWAASSFKGSTGSSQYYTNITHHMSNHLAWIDVILEAKKIAPHMKFRGVTLTGWQRYDHFATLCELLPSAIPALSLCLVTIKKGGFTQADHKYVQNALGCSDTELLQCTFPGHDLYESILKLKMKEDFFKKNDGLQSRLNGWLTDYNIKHGFGSPGQLRVLEKHINETRANFTSVRPELKRNILKYYDQYTVDEWISVHVDQKLNFLSRKLDDAKKLRKIRIFSKRPLISKYNQLDDGSKQRLENTNAVPSGNQNLNPILGRSQPLLDANGNQNPVPILGRSQPLLDGNGNQNPGPILGRYQPLLDANGNQNPVPKLQSNFQPVRYQNANPQFKFRPKNIQRNRNDPSFNKFDNKDRRSDFANQLPNNLNRVGNDERINRQRRI